MARRKKQDLGRRGLSRPDWERLVAEHRRGGQTRQAFCAARGLSVSTLDYWRRKLGDEPAAPGFIELGPLEGGSAWDIELELGGGVVLRFRRR